MAKIKRFFLRWIVHTLDLVAIFFGIAIAGLALFGSVSLHEKVYNTKHFSFLEGLVWVVVPMLIVIAYVRYGYLTYAKNRFRFLRGGFLKPIEKKVSKSKKDPDGVYRY